MLDLRSGRILPPDFILDQKPLWPAREAEFSPVFPYYSIIEDPELETFNSTLEGTLVLDRGYLRFNAINGVSYLPFWNLNADKKRISATAGERSTLQGAEVTRETLKKYTFWYSIPEEWKGPFWIVKKYSIAKE